MWWHDKHAGLSLLSRPGQARERAAARLSSPAPVGRRSVLRAAGAMAMAALAGGCFQPLYGEQSPMGGPVLRDQLSAVDIVQIEAPKGSDEARLAVEVRNALLFDFSGGGSPAPPTHRLKISMYSTRAAIIVDVNTSRPDIENYGINATYSLTEIATAKVVVTGQTFAWVSYDIPPPWTHYVESFETERAGGERRKPAARDQAPKK